MSKQQLKLGDAIAKLAQVLRIPHCPECEQRRLILNEIQKVGVRETVRRLRAVGFSYSAKRANERSVEDIVKKMEECCDE